MSDPHMQLEALEETLSDIKRKAWADARELEEWFAEARKEIAANLKRGEGFLSVGIRIRTETVFPTVAWRRFYALKPGAKPMARDYRKPKKAWAYDIGELQKNCPEAFHALIAETERRAQAIRQSVLLAHDLMRILKTHSRRIAKN